mmetsp:Transcript_13846/g.19215  ORF Transcript_13846/g.19215 Transcript_13846/m.19215 type:complete len:122 (+) Transcript_13846:1011-1376(+)
MELFRYSDPSQDRPYGDINDLASAFTPTNKSGRHGQVQQQKSFDILTDLMAEDGANDSAPEEETIERISEAKSNKTPSGWIGKDLINFEDVTAALPKEEPKKVTMAELQGETVNVNVGRRF